MKKRPYANGFTLIELSIAIAIAGVVVLGAVRYGSILFGDMEQSRFNQRMSQSILGIENIFLTRSDYQGLSLQSAVNHGLLNDNQVKLDGSGNVVSVRHLYGGDLNIAPLSGPFSNLFWGMHFDRIPKRDCVSLVQAALPMGSVVAIKGEAGSVSSLGEWISTVNFSINRTDINFPSGYSVIKHLNKDIVPPPELVQLCKLQNSATFGLVVIRRKI